MIVQVVRLCLGCIYDSEERCLLGRPEWRHMNVPDCIGYFEFQEKDFNFPSGELFGMMDIPIIRGSDGTV